MIQKIDKKAVQDAVQMAYDRCKNETGGKNADYIPYLADVPSNLFGIAACLPDGDVVAVGDTDYKFGIESVSKVPTAILAMNQYGGQEVLGKIGADATGLPFNSIMAILLENDHPSTPLVNAGAISACSMIKPVGDSDGKWKADRLVHRRPRGIGRRGDRRTLQIGDGDQLQQQVDRVAAEELQPHLRRSRHGAGHLHAPVLDRRDGPAAGHDGRDDRQQRREPRDRKGRCSSPS